MDVHSSPPTPRPPPAQRNLRELLERIAETPGSFVGDYDVGVFSVQARGETFPVVFDPLTGRLNFLDEASLFLAVHENLLPDSPTDVRLEVWGEPGGFGAWCGAAMGGEYKIVHAGGAALMRYESRAEAACALWLAVEDAK